VDKGTTFSVYLPVYEKNPLEEKEVSNKINSIEIINTVVDEISKTENDGKVNKTVSKPLILIVEDNSDLRSFLKNELQDNYRVIEAVNGKEGLDQAI
ncbi:MAG TPA: hypothetical protein VIH57_26310, partial [Bacteroidales bacterium]